MAGCQLEEKNKTNMDKLTKKIIENLNFDAYYLIEEERDNIIALDGKQLMIDLLNRDDMWNTKVSYLFKRVPEIWKDFNLSDWQEIMRSVHRPAAYRPNVDDEANFEDIRFLYNWIGINSLDLYKNTPNISDADRAVIERKGEYLLFDSDKTGDDYKRWFTDGTYGNIQYFKDMKARLISQGAKANLLPDL